MQHIWIQDKSGAISKFNLEQFSVMYIPPRHHVVLIKTSIVYGVVNGKINECSKENPLILNNFTNLLAATGRKCLFLWWLHTFLLIDVIFYFFFPMF